MSLQCWIRGFTLFILTKIAPAWTAPQRGPSGPLQPLTPVLSYGPKCGSLGQVFTNSPPDPGHKYPHFKLPQPKKYKNNKKSNNKNTKTNNNIQEMYFTWEHTDVPQSPSLSISELWHFTPPIRNKLRISIVHRILKAALLRRDSSVKFPCQHTIATRTLIPLVDSSTMAWLDKIKWKPVTWSWWDLESLFDWQRPPAAWRFNWRTGIDSLKWIPVIKKIKYIFFKKVYKQRDRIGSGGGADGGYGGERPSWAGTGSSGEGEC